jgi:hypothetical protein
MREIAPLIVAAFNSTPSKQYKVLVKSISLFTSILIATALYVYFFGYTLFDWEAKRILTITLNPRSIIWLLFFLAIFFMVFPIMYMALLAAYAILYSSGKHIKREYLEGARAGFKLAGVEEKLKQLSSEQIKEIYSEVKSESYESEKTAIELLSYLFTSILLLIFCYGKFISGGWLLKSILICSDGFILVGVLTITPWAFSFTRAHLDDQLRKVQDEGREVESQLQEKN